MNSGLERDLNNIGIEVQTGIKSAVQEGEYVAGTWNAEGEMYRIGEGRAIALDVLNPFLRERSFANAVLEFTRKFGPLTIPFSRGESFRFSIREWKTARRALHFVWKAAASGRRSNRAVKIPCESNLDYFNRSQGRLTFRTQTLSTYAALEIASIPAELLRTCENQKFGCKSPFFFASDLRERYCSATCAHEAKKRIKLKWWNENRRGK